MLEVLGARPANPRIISDFMKYLSNEGCFYRFDGGLMKTLWLTPRVIKFYVKTIQKRIMYNYVMLLTMWNWSIKILLGKVIYIWW